MATGFVMVLEIHNAGDRVFLRSILINEALIRTKSVSIREHPHEK
jgi:hypothetical protein